jgi:hypothetical protein
MNIVPPGSGLHALAAGVDVNKMDAFLDDVFETAARCRNVACCLGKQESLRLESDGAVLQEEMFLRAKTMLRMLCARLAVRCGEWAGRDVSPYGDVVEFEHASSKRRCRVSFQNTSASQRFEVETI